VCVLRLTRVSCKLTVLRCGAVSCVEQRAEVWEREPSLRVQSKDASTSLGESPGERQH
jgi:hypothetical protein